jgi:glycosyltransferase involved in cell wall biosynthesis
MVFISRLHYKKGLDILIDAWPDVASQAPQWKLVIAAPDDGYERALRQAIETNGCKDSVIMLPAQYDQAKYDLLAAAECFVLPSRSEGLPMALLEAMAVGKPVVYTTTCYLPEAAKCGAGYEVECSAVALAQASRQIMESQPRRLIEMGQRGQALVRQKYLWSRIAGQFEEVYRWLVSSKQTPAPSTIRMFSPK